LAGSLDRDVGTLAILGDSIAVGVGEPVAGGAWRGFASLLASAVGATRLVNVASNGARVGCVHDTQLPAALRAAPDTAVVLAGMNDTMRSDFDPVRLHDQLDNVVSSLSASGAAVVTIRYHDHGRIFPLPRPLRQTAASIRCPSSVGCNRSTLHDARW
jgi:lysophospholipase L1-like esterase